MKRRSWAIAGVVATAWLLAGFWLVPGLIHQAYRQESLPLLNAMLAGRDQHAVEVYLAAWRRLFLVATGLIGVGAPLLVLASRQRTVRSWLGRLVKGSGGELGAVDVLLVAVLVGALTGVVESVGHLIRIGPRRPNFGGGYTAELLWAAPVANAAIFLIGAALLLVVPMLIARRKLPLRVAPFVAVTVAVFVAFVSLRVGIHVLAAALLAVGVASQAARAADRRAIAFTRLVRVGTGAVLGVAVLIAAVASLRGGTTEARAASTTSGGPNVLLLILDTVRAANLSVYGYDRPTTPFLTQLAPNAIVFDRALATTTWTGPSHAALFTGRYPHELSYTDVTRYDGAFPTLAEIFSGHGYRTGAIIANSGYVGRRSGLLTGFDVIGDSPAPLGKRLLTNSWLARGIAKKVTRDDGALERWGAFVRKSAPEVTSQFLRFVDSRKDAPFFAVLNYMDAHHPYPSPPPYDSMFSGRKPRIRLDWHDRYTKAELRDFRNAYDASIAYLDDQLRLLMAGLEQRGLRENTLIVITSDHGELFGERKQDEVLHMLGLNYRLLHVPLMIVAPNAPGGQRVPVPVSLRDVPATILELAGLPNEAIPGISLASPGSGFRPDIVPSPVLSEFNVSNNPSDLRVRERHWSLMSGDYHYAVRSDSVEELYHVGRDPWELTNLAQTDEGRPLLPGFRIIVARATGEKWMTELAKPDGSR
jgi:arylsulfatase A-like enzyme